MNKKPTTTKAKLFSSVLSKLCDGLNAISSISIQSPKNCQVTWPSSACLWMLSSSFGYKNLKQNWIDLLPSAHILPCNSWKSNWLLRSQPGSLLLSENNRWEHCLLQAPWNLKCHKPHWLVPLRRRNSWVTGFYGLGASIFLQLFRSPFVSQKEGSASSLSYWTLGKLDAFFFPGPR